MKRIILVVVCVALVGCGKQKETAPAVAKTQVVQVPADVVTHTVTRKKFVPVYQGVVETNTSTTPGSAPLHEARVVDNVPEPGK